MTVIEKIRKKVVRRKLKNKTRADFEYKEPVFIKNNKYV